MIAGMATKTFGPLDEIAFGSQNFYQIIGVPRDADAKVVRKAYIRAILAAHPDKHGGDDTLAKQLNVAYGALKVPASRRSYDRELDRRAREAVRGGGRAGGGRAGGGGGGRAGGARPRQRRRGAKKTKPRSSPARRQRVLSILFTRLKMVT